MRSAFLFVFSLFMLLSFSRASAEVATGTPVFSDPTTFSNEFFPFTPGGVKVHRGDDEGEKLVVTELFLADTRTFQWNGGTVVTRVLREVEFENGELVEISDNYFAEADDGTVYYFGEVVDDYEDGVIVEHDGSWLVGGATLPSDPVDTANATNPALFMPANPEVDDSWKPEDLFPFVDETVTCQKFVAKHKTEGGKFKNVMQVKETSALDSGSEKKWYARGVGVIHAVSSDEDLELVASTFLPLD
jgi:hypothetical protein